MYAARINGRVSPVDRETFIEVLHLVKFLVDNERARGCDERDVIGFYKELIHRLSFSDIEKLGDDDKRIVSSLYPIHYFNEKVIEKYQKSDTKLLWEILESIRPKFRWGNSLVDKFFKSLVDSTDRCVVTGIPMVRGYIVNGDLVCNYDLAVQHSGMRNEEFERCLRDKKNKSIRRFIK